MEAPWIFPSDYITSQEATANNGTDLMRKKIKIKNLQGRQGFKIIQWEPSLDG